MARFQMLEVVLLGCDYTFAPERDDDFEPAVSEATGWPTEDILKLGIAVTATEPHYFVVLDGLLDDPRLEFEMRVRLGARFQYTPGEDQPSENAVESTLSFMMFPFLRELVADITGRAPTGPYFLPPRAPRPFPSETAE